MLKVAYNTCIGYNAGPTGPSTSSYNLYIDPVYRGLQITLIWGYGFGTTGRKLYLNAQVRILYDLYVRRCIPVFRCTKKRYCRYGR